MLYRNHSIYDTTPITYCPRVRHFLRQDGKMQYVKTLSKVDRERYTRKLQVFYGAVGDSGVRTDPYEILQEKWSASVSSWRPVELEISTRT